MTLEKVGFFAVIENFNEYISEVRTMQNEHTKLGASQKGVEESSRSTGAALGGLASALAVAAAGYISLSTISGAIEKTTEMGEATHQLQLVTGATAEQASSLIGAMHELGIAPEEAIASFGIFARNLTNTLDALRQGKDVSTPFANSLAAMNIKILDSNGNLRPFHDLLLDVADAFEKAGPGFDTTARAMDIFGRNGKALLPFLLEGRQGILDMEAAAKKLGVTLSQDNVNAIHQYVVESRAADEAISGLKLKLALELLPTLTLLATYFSEHADDIRHWVDVAISALGDLVQYVGQPIADAIAGFEAIKAGIADVADFISDLAHGRWAEAWGDLKSVALDILHLLLVDVAALFGFLPNLIIDAVNVAIREVNKVKIPEIDIAGRNVVPGAGRGPGIPEIPQIFPSFELPSLGKATAQVKEHGKALQEEGQAAAGAAKEDAELKKAIDDVKAGTISYKDALKLGLTATQAGMLEALVKVRDAEDEAAAKGFLYTESLAMIAEAYRENQDAADRLVQKQAEATMKALDTAESALFAKPTREVAELAVQTDKLQLALDQAKNASQPYIDSLNDQKDALERSKQAISDEKDALSEAADAISRKISDLQDQPLTIGAGSIGGTGPGGPSQQQQDLAKANRDAEVKQLEHQKQALEDSGKALDRQSKIIDHESQSIASAINVRQHELTIMERRITALNGQTKIEEDRKKLLQDQYTASNALLLTDKQQAKEAATLRDESAFASGALHDLYVKTGTDLVPEVGLAYEQFRILKGEMAVLNDPDHMQGILDKSFDVKGSFDRLTTSADAAATKLSELAQQNFFAQAGAAGAGAGVGSGGTGATGVGGGHSGGGGGGGGGGSFDVGGFTNSPVQTWLSKDARPEVVLPLTDASRSRELLSMLPASLLASIAPRGGMTFAPSINVTASDFDAAVAKAHQELDRHVGAARTAARRAGTVITGTIG